MPRRFRPGPQAVQNIQCPRCRMTSTVRYRPYPKTITLACWHCQHSLEVDLDVPVIQA